MMNRSESRRKTEPTYSPKMQQYCAYIGICAQWLLLRNNILYLILCSLWVIGVNSYDRDSCFNANVNCLLPRPVAFIMNQENSLSYMHWFPNSGFLLLYLSECPAKVHCDTWSYSRKRLCTRDVKLLDKTVRKRNNLVYFLVVIN